jgi:tripartite-type tricarboxylate transporter receptor subunit TctC
MAIIGLAFFAGAVHATTHEFYKGKTIRIIVGFSAGGGFDTYTRVTARHLGKHIPGNPTIIVENMTGAGSLVAANYIYNIAKPDGLTIGNFIGPLLVQQLLGNPAVKFDAVKFGYIGVPVQDNFMLGISARTGIKSIEEWFKSKKVIKFGGLSPGTPQDDVPKIVEATIGLPIRIVSGYKGTSTIKLAFNSGEVDGVVNSWESFKATWRNEVESGDLVIVLQNIPKRHPELPNVPVAIDFAKTEEARKIIRASLHTLGPTLRPYVLPPGTPKDRVEILRKAFMVTMEDPEFLPETKKAKLDINPLSGAELESNVREVFNLEPSLVAKLKEILK